MFHRTRKPASRPIGQAAPEFSSPLVIVGDASDIRDFLCGPQQHNEHCKGWRWHLYRRDDWRRFDNVMAELNRMHAERRARIEALRTEADELESTI